MKRTALVVGLSLALAAAPAAFAAPPGTVTTGPDAAAGKPETKPVAPQAKGKAKTQYLIRACVTQDASANAVQIKVLSANAHARKNGAKKSLAPFDVDITGAKVTLVGEARIQQGTKVKLPKLGSYENLTQGDVITLRARAPRGTAVTSVVFTSVVDNGPIRPKVCPPAAAPSAPAPAASAT
jgi:hypothetical protein